MPDFNKLTIGIVSLTVGHWDLMFDHINSLYDTYPFGKNFYLIPNCRYEMSLAQAMNTGFKRALNDNCDAIIYCADDVVAGKDSMQSLIDTLLTERLWMVNGLGPNSSGWDFFAIHPTIFHEVGFWDECFYPAYFEDNSFARRLTLKTTTKYKYIPIEFIHHGSQTIKRMDPESQKKHHHNFSRVSRLYQAMWGGVPGKEIYTVPFNGENITEFMGLKINPPEIWNPTFPTKFDYAEFAGI